MGGGGEKERGGGGKRNIGGAGRVIEGKGGRRAFCGCCCRQRWLRDRNLAD